MSAIPGNKLLVTGCSGLLGRHALESVCNRFDCVVGTYCNNQPEQRLPGVEYRRLDFTLPDSGRELREIAPDILVHCSALIPQTYHDPSAIHAAEQNRLIDECVISYCQSANCRLVFPSSMSVYGLKLNGPTKECVPTHPEGSYAIGKFESEQRIVDRLKSYAVLRLSAPYGVGQQTKTVLQIFIQKALEESDLSYYGTGARKQDFTAARDVAAAVLASALSDVNGIFNIASGQPISMKALAELVVDETGSPSQIAVASQRDPQEHFQASFCIQKAADELGWRPSVTLRSGIRELIAFGKAKPHGASVKRS